MAHDGSCFVRGLHPGCLCRGGGGGGGGGGGPASRPGMLCDISDSCVDPVVAEDPPSYNKSVCTAGKTVGHNTVYCYPASGSSAGLVDLINCHVHMSGQQLQHSWPGDTKSVSTVFILVPAGLDSVQGEASNCVYKFCLSSCSW